MKPPSAKLVRLVTTTASIAALLYLLTLVGLRGVARPASWQQQHQNEELEAPLLVAEDGDATVTERDPLPYTVADVRFARSAGLYLVPRGHVMLPEAEVRRIELYAGANDTDVEEDAVHVQTLAAGVDAPQLVRGVVVMLARNEDVEGAVSSVRQLEARFNHRFHYPYVYLNNEPFSPEFRARLRAVSPLSRVRFGLIPHEHWSYPTWINQTRAADVRADMAARRIIYGGSESYRHMCRYNSGFFFLHPLLAPYDYYWRVEPNVDFTCDVTFDPFRRMQENNYLYSYTISLYEYMETIPTLWDTIRAHVAAEPAGVRGDDGAVQFVTTDGTAFNQCHFWSNFEVASLHLWRSRAYTRLFRRLDDAGGFFYERWGK